jgi:hypothetical protein
MEKYPLKKNIRTESIAAVDSTKMVGIYYVGPYKFAKAIASQTAATALVLKADDTDGETTTALTVNVTASTTYGAVVDAINALNGSGWYAYLIGARRADLAYNGSTEVTWTAIPVALTSCYRTPIYLYHDTSRLLTTLMCLPIGVTNRDIGSYDRGNIIEVVNFSIKTTGTKSGNVINVYSCNDDAKTDNLIYSCAGGGSTVAVAKTQDDFGDEPLTSGKGERLVFREQQATNALSVPEIFVRYRVTPYEPGGSTWLHDKSKM